MPNKFTAPIPRSIVLHFVTVATMLLSAPLPVWSTDITSATPGLRPQITLPAMGEEVPLARIHEICTFYGLNDLWQKIERDPPPRPFKSDGCTGWVNEWQGISIYPAGFLHDLKYWAGYPGEDVDRLVADAELMIDVARLLNSTTMAETMFHGVRIGGNERMKASFSWGFGRTSSATKPGEK